MIKLKYVDLLQVQLEECIWEIYLRHLYQKDLLIKLMVYLY